MEIKHWFCYVEDGKVKATTDYKLVDRRFVIGIPAFKKRADAIAYCISMGFDNSFQTDSVPMSPTQKGEILYLFSQKHTPLDIAEKVNRSIDWIMNITGGITGNARQELINQYLEEKDNAESFRNSKSKTKTAVQSTPKRSTNSRNNSRKTKRAVSIRTHERRRNSQRSEQQHDSGISTGKSRIVDTLRKSKDYMGE